MGNDSYRAAVIAKIEQQREAHRFSSGSPYYIVTPEQWKVLTASDGQECVSVPRNVVLLAASALVATSHHEVRDALNDALCATHGETK